MNVKLTPRDYEALSAYLDGELNPRDKARLEENLRTDPIFRDELKEIKKTRILLRSQPRLRAPRNFTLTSQMAGVRTSAPARVGAYPVLRLASMLAAVFFVVVFVGELVGSSLQPNMIAMSDTSQQAPMAVPGFGMGGGGGGGGAAEAVPPAEPSVAAAQTESPAAAVSGESALKAMPGEATAEAQAELAPAEPLADEPAQNPALSNDAQQFAPAEEQSQQSDNLQTEERTTRSAWSLLRILQVVLALTAVITGLAALALRRRPV